MPRFLALWVTIFLLAPAFTFSQALMGTYTIGGITPDYASFNGAVSALVTNGIAGPVIFDVRNGIYTEQVHIPQIFGVSSANTITFRSQNGDSSQVVLQFNSLNPVENYTLLLDTMDYVTVSKITIRAKGNTYGRALVLRGGADHNQILNCALESTSGNGVSDDKAVVYNSDLSLDNYNLIRNCLVRGGNIGIYFQGISPTQLESGTRLEHNQIQDSTTSRSVMLWYQDSLTVENNLISSETPSSSYLALQMQSCEDISLTGNRVEISKGGYGLYLSSVTAGLSPSFRVANNFVATGGSGIYWGIFLVNCQHADVVFNSVHHFGSNAQGGALCFSGGTGNKLFNNILAASGINYPFSAVPVAVVDSIDYNDYFANGPFLADWNGNQTSLSALQLATGQDANSLAVDPNFYSNLDLHATQFFLDGAARPFTGITQDIDGDSRNLTTPDMGADEFSALSLNAKPVALGSFTFPYCDSVISPTVSIENQGLTTLTSLQINWSVNGILQTPVSFSGNLPAGATSAPINLGAFTFGAANSAWDFVVWTSQPNGSPDQFTANDTIKKLQFYRPLQGFYTIGGTSPDFTTINEAVYFLEKGGVCDSVVFNLRPGFYNEQFTLTEIRGASLLNNITFQSEFGDTSQVEINFSGTSTQNYVANLDSADFIRFRNLTFRSTGTTYSRIIQLQNGACLNRIVACHLIAPFPATTSYGNHACIYSPATKDTANLIRANQFNGGGMGIVFAQNSSGREGGNRILENKLRNVQRISIDLFSQERLEVKANLISVDLLNALPTAGRGGIRLNTSQNDIEISGNKIWDHITEGVEIISGNSVIGREMLIANNFISTEGDGLFVGHKGALVFANNLYYHNANDLGTHRVLEMAGTDRVMVRNNNLVNKSAPNSQTYVLFYGTGNTNSNLDFNNYYSEGLKLTRFNSLDYNTLNAWQSISGQDANSFSVDPHYYNTQDLHICNSDLIGQGDNLPNVYTDIDGDGRPLQQTIGADELIALVTLPEDTTICAPLSLDVYFPLAFYLWSDSSTSPSLVVDSSGIYSVQIISAYCGVISDTIAVYSIASLSEGLGPDTVGCDSVLIGMAYPSVSYLWSTGSTLPQIVAPVSGNYSVTYSASCGVVSDTLAVNVVPHPHGFLGPNVHVCDDTLLLVDPGPLYNSFLWFDNSTNPTYTFQNVGTYWVSVTDTFGCAGSDTIVVTFSQFWQGVDLGPDTTLCPGKTTFFNAGGGYQSYLWSDNSTNQLLITNQPGQYWVQTVANDGCIYQDTILLSPGLAAQPFLGNDTLICQGSTLQLDGGAQYVAWNWPSGPSVQFYNVASPGQYTVTVTGNQGCNGSDTILVGFHPLQSVGLGPNLSFCPGDTFALSPGNNFQTYLWQDNSNQPTFPAVTAGTYYVTATDFNGCVGSDTVNLGLYTLPVVNLGPDQQACVGDTILLNAGSGLNSYLWNPGNSTNQTLNVLTSGTYSVNVTDLHGCKGSDAITLNFTQPQFSLGADTVLCNGSSLLLNAGSGFVAYLWSPGASTNSSLLVDTSGTYAATVTDGDGCTATDAINVTFEGPVADFAFTSNQLSVSFADISQGNPQTWAWDFGDGNNSATASPSHTYAVSGTYQVCLTVTNANGCSDQYCDSVTVLGIGLHEDLSLQVSVFPNPTSGSIFVRSEVGGEFLALLADLQGRILKKTSLIMESGRDQEVDLQGISQGIYLLRLQSGDRQTVFRIEFVE
ncbi:MAG: PKD domain-containing protein [Bacteroidia bacterium]|nr:PKD domain-containing protein [Bacteroidia bacterium]